MTYPSPPDRAEPARYTVCGQETADAVTGGQPATAGGVNLSRWPTVLLVLPYSVFRLLLESLVDRRHPEAELRLELLLLRYQVGVLQREVKRPRCRTGDRLPLTGLSQAPQAWVDAEGRGRRGADLLRGLPTEAVRRAGQEHHAYSGDIGSSLTR